MTSTASGQVGCCCCCLCLQVSAGYGDEVIFADGTFMDGSTAEA
jgi:cystathionine beta-lyase family protein involved in aluminum resistance